VRALPSGALELYGHTESILAVAFDPTGKWAATGGLDRSVRLWDLEQKRLLWAKGPSDEAVTVLAFDPKGDVIAAGDRAFQVRLYQAHDGTLLRRRAHPDTVSSVAFSPDGRWLAVGGSNGNAEVYPAGDDGPSKCEVRGRTVEFTDQGKNVVSATPSGNLVVTALAGCKRVKETSTAPHLPYAASSATAALVGTRNGAEPLVLLWDALKGRMLGKLDRQSGGVSSLQLSSDGKRALVGSEDHHVRLYDVEKREVLESIETGSLPFAALSPDGRRALIGEGLVARVLPLKP
jgi:WD40 repeat protein